MPTSECPHIFHGFFGSLELRGAHTVAGGMHLDGDLVGRCQLGTYSFFQGADPVKHCCSTRLGRRSSSFRKPRPELC